jgi:hypothetical protein
MRDTSLLQLALAIVPPWTVTGSDFDAAARRLDIHIDFAAGSRFACPSCGATDCPAYDSEQMTWHTDLSLVTRVAIDETAARRDHNYVTLFVDIDRARVVFTTQPPAADRYDTASCRGGNAKGEADRLFFSRFSQIPALL